MRSDLFLFFGILIFIFVVWVATGGPSRPISFSGPFITPITTVGGHGVGYGLSRGTSTATSSATIQRSLSAAQQDIINLQKSLVANTHFGPVSPFKGLVTIRHSVGSLRTSDPNKEYLTISVSTRASSGIGITGWRIESEVSGNNMRIPSGVSLPKSTLVNDSAPIVLSPGETAIITTGESPVGMSFRENMCTGYFDQFQNFTPSLPNICPSASDDFDRFFPGSSRTYDACKAVIKTVSRCEVPLKTPPLSSDCQNFIDKYIYYNGCVAAHTADKGFFGTTWRIFVSRDKEFFTKTHDTIKLLDLDEKTVDLLSY
jgi:hypothetical protein